MSTSFLILPVGDDVRWLDELEERWDPDATFGAPEEIIERIKAASIPYRDAEAEGLVVDDPSCAFFFSVLFSTHAKGTGVTSIDVRPIPRGEPTPESVGVRVIVMKIVAAVGGGAFDPERGDRLENKPNS